MSMPNPPAGVFSTADQTRPGATYLPLEALTSDVYIADVSARVVLSQLYCNPAQTSIREAHYVFPVPARASVCRFEARTDDGRRLKGVVKEITEAKADYEDAVREGKLAALLQQVTHDVFSVCLGTIPPRTNITVVLSYVMNLAPDDQHDTVRFQLPFHVGARYGAPPTSALYHGTAHRARVSITAWVQMASRIIAVSSPSHPNIENISRDAAHWQRASSVPDDNLACRRWVSQDTFLDTDFLLVVQATGLDKPRCLAETLSPGHSSAIRKGCSTTALALTVVPRFDLPALPIQAYIFIIDRSGSMSGPRIEIAKKALCFLLRMLPPGNASMFDIFSFGIKWSSLWLNSQCYNNATLYQATSHANTMDADMGGTELFSVLQHVLLQSRTNGIPTSVFVLTDGGISNPQGAISLVHQMVSSAPASAPLRVFTLGVGHGASTALCEGLAAAGNGVCAMAVQTEDLMLKAIRLVNAMRVSTVEDLAVDWEVPGQELQAPYPIQNISPGVRMVVTTILSNHTPTQVVLRGRLSDGSVLDFPVPVLPLSFPLPSIDFGDAQSDLEVPPLLHTLAAHRYILALERGILELHGPHFAGVNDNNRQGLIKDRIVELATQYQVASAHTAFVAVDAPNPPRRPKSPPKPPSGTPKPPTSTPKPPKATPNGQSKSPTGTPKPPPATPKPPTASPDPPAATPKPSASKAPTAAPESPPAAAKSPITSPAPPGTPKPPNSTPKPPTSTPKSPPAAAKSPIGSPAPATPKPPTASGQPPTASPAPPASPRPPTPHPGDAGKGAGRKSSRAASHTSRRSGGKASTRSARSLSPASARSSTASPALPGAWSGDGGRRADFYAYDPPGESAPHEVMIFSGGVQPVICTAPPLQQTSVFSWFPGRAFMARVFRAPRQAGAAAAQAGAAAVQSVWRNVWAADVASTAALLDFSLSQSADGAFALDYGLASAVGVSEASLRSAMPPSVAASSDGEKIWATAVAVAFLRCKYARQKEVWEILEEKASVLGAQSLAGGRNEFEDLVQEALKLF